MKDGEPGEIEAVRFPSRSIGRVALGTFGGIDPVGLAPVVDRALEGVEAAGPALALAIAEALEAELPPGTPWVAFSVGDAVVRGLPTAARLSIAARTPGREGVVEAQVGGTFARGFALHHDVLVLAGDPGPEIDRVLTIGADGGLAGRSLEPSDLAGDLANLFDRARALRGEGEALLLRGRGGDLGLPLSNVASLTSEDGTPPSFVGRGGMGAAFARVGLVGVTVAERTESPEAHPFAADLARSPRLLSRAHGGTLELASSHGEVVAGASVGERPTKHGCKGCPTPCGWTFRAGDDGAVGRSIVGGRFSAMRAAPEGIDPLEFVARCNALGLDAQGAGQVAGQLATQAGWMPEDIVDPASPAHLAAQRLSAEEPAFESVGAHRGDLAAQVGARVSARGPEPLRSLSVLGAGSARAEDAVAPLPWTGGEDAALDAASLAHFHGAFAAALDMVGFCAFSAAGLVADGVLPLDELAARLAPPAGWWKGACDRLAMLRAGEAHLLRHRRLGGGPGSAQVADPELRRAVDLALALEGEPAFQMRSGAPAATARSTGGGVTAPAEAAAVLTVVADGLLGLRMGADHRRMNPDSSQAMVKVVMGAGALMTVASAVVALAELVPQARTFLVGSGGDPLPAVLRGGRVLGAGDEVRDGDVLKLVLVIAGG